MTNRFPLSNPLRFQDAAKLIDYTNNMPSFDLMRLGEDYQRGIYANKNYIVDFKIGKEISIIMQSSEAFTGTIFFPDGSSAAMARTEITGGSWVGDKYRKYSYTITQEGAHQILLAYSAYGVNYNYYSDPFYASDPSGLKDLVEVRYYDTQNTNGGFWFDETTQNWNPFAYYTGHIKPLQPENEISTFNDDGGILTKTRSVPKRIAQIRLTDVNFDYLDVFNFQVQCSNVYINGVKYTVEDVTPEEKEKSDLIDITAKLTQSESENDFLLT